MSHTLLTLPLQVLQLYQITTLCHGLMMVGPSGSGKSTAWRVLLKALTRLEGIEVGSLHCKKCAVKLKIWKLWKLTSASVSKFVCCLSRQSKSKWWIKLYKSQGVSHVIDPKAISKDVLYGTMDPNTREWTDGLFTHILRKIIDNVRGMPFVETWLRETFYISQ